MNFEIYGDFKTILAKLEGLGPDIKKKALRNAIRKGANTFRKAAIKKVPKRTGAVAKNIRVQFASRTSKKINGIAFRVGVRGGAQEPGAKVRYARTKKGRRSSVAEGSSTWYWRLLEFGTEKMQARSFLRPAFYSQSTRIADQVAKDLEKAIKKYTQEGAKTK
jgi:HK97 gp10 family phage protein